MKKSVHNTYLNFKEANCKNCYKCLHECPVKAITVIGDQARIKDELCVLCGHCSNVCRYSAKEVVDDTKAVKELIKSGSETAVSLAPAFVSSFHENFDAVVLALKKLGFTYVEETARGAHAVTAEYKDLLDSKKYKNLIASACPALVRLVQIYYPAALKYIAPVDSPMIAHAKMLKKERPTAKIIFIGPCIAKKREADESGAVDFVLTFEELSAMLAEKNITFNECVSECEENRYFSSAANTLQTQKTSQTNNKDENKQDQIYNKAKYYPINRGIIKAFEGFCEGYEYISVDGMARAAEVLENIESLNGMFIEMHACEFSCINGPCALNKKSGGFIKATEKIRAYAGKGKDKPRFNREKGNFKKEYLPIKDIRQMPAEYEIRAILESIGKFTPDDELNCGSCGYNTCRDKAIAVYNHMAEPEMCLPFMRERAETLSYDIIQNSPNGILAVDGKFCISEINEKAAVLLGTTRSHAKGELLEKFCNPTDFYLAMFDDTVTDNKKVYLDKTQSYVEMSIRRVKNQNTLFCIMKDITQDTDYKNKLSKIKSDTIVTTNEVIEKQMRVVQEIASLLGETAAETKIALIKLKETLKD